MMLARASYHLRNNLLLELHALIHAICCRLHSWYGYAQCTSINFTPYFMEKTNSPSLTHIWSLSGGVFLISFSVIAFEITLSRLLSVVLSHHYVFIILSLTMLGLGMGGMGVHLFWKKLSPEENRYFLPLVACLFSITLPLSVILIATHGYISTLRNSLLFYCLILLVPFLLAGLLLAYIFRVHSLSSGKLYGADLLGGATGALAVIFLLNILGGVSTGILIGVSASMAALFFSVKKDLNFRAPALSLFTFVAVSSLCGVNLSGMYTPSIAMGKNPDKEIYDALSKFRGKIIKTKWSAFGRTDLITFDDIPDHKDIYIDGTAGSPMYRFTGSAADPGVSAERLKSTFPGYFPFLNLREEEREKGLIIGPGGGRDILLALMGGVKKLTAVEINRDLVDLVTDFSDYNGGIYLKHANVKVVVEEGRHFLKGAGDTYDLIFLSLPVTNTSRSLEGYALTENFLFTTDSIQDYLDHLTDAGRLIVVAHNDMEALRLLTISLTALAEKGITTSEAMKHIYIVGSEDYLVFVLKKTPFTPQNIRLRYRTMQTLPLEPLSSYFPYIRFPGAVNPILASLAAGGITKEKLIEMVRERGYDISPVTDNMPFFYKFDVGTPRPVALALWASLALLTFMIGYSLLFLRNKTPASSHTRGRRAQARIIVTWNILFMMVGAGFMAIEISMIQKFVLFLGRPILSLVVLLFSLLVGAGTGSYASSRLKREKISRGIAYASLGVTLIVLGYILILPALITHFLSLSTPARIGIALALLLPLGFVMGFPFPLGIRLLKEVKREHHIPWAWGVNGVSSVLGSALTVTMAIHYGFTQALLFGALCYFSVFVTFLRQRSM